MERQNRFLASWIVWIKFILCFPLVLLIGWPAFGLTKYLFSTAEDGVQDYQRFGSAYLIRPGAEEWVRLATEDALFFSVFILIKVLAALLVLWLVSRFIPVTRAKRLRGSEWHACAVFLALFVFGIGVQFFVFSTPCGDADQDAVLRSSQITFLGLIVAAAPSLFLGPVFEEIEIRGVVFRFLQAWGSWTRISLTSIIFVYPHLVNHTGQFIPVDALHNRTLILSSILIWFPLGLAAGYARDVSGGLRLPILLHMLFNIGFAFFGASMAAIGRC